MQKIEEGHICFGYHSSSALLRGMVNKGTGEAYMPRSQVKAVAVFVGSPPQQVAIPKVGMKASQFCFSGARLL